MQYGWDALSARHGRMGCTPQPVTHTDCAWDILGARGACTEGPGYARPWVQ